MEIEKEMIIQQVDEMMNKTEFAEERVELAGKILKICEDNDWIDMSSVTSQSFLNKLANYILYAPVKNRDEEEKIKEQLVMDYNEFRKIMKNEEPTENVLYILFKEKNYRKPIIQEITHQDLIDYKVIKELQNYITLLRNSNIERQLAVKHMRLVKEDQKIIKDSITGQFYFKRVDPISTKYDLNLIDLANPKVIRKVLPFIHENQIDFTKDLDCIFYDLKNAINNLKLDYKKMDILDRFMSGDDVRKIANETGNYYNFIDRAITTICKKIASNF